MYISGYDMVEKQSQNTLYKSLCKSCINYYVITLIKYCEVFTLQNGNSTTIKWLNQIFALFLLAEVVCNHKKELSHCEE